MRRRKGKPVADTIEQMLGEASWLLSHAQALFDYGRKKEAETELASAATCEEQVACLLEADGQELEAAIHRVSAASCYERLKQFARAVTLLRAALSARLNADYRAALELRLQRALKQSNIGLNQSTRRGKRKQLVS